MRNKRFRAPWKRTFVFLSDGKDRVQRTKQDGRPKARCLWKRAECQNVSKALEKSMVAELYGLEAFSFESVPDRLGQEKNLVIR